MHRTEAVAAAPRLMERSIGRGFTLIELLVVVGIIAVLMAILLPALGRARQEVLKVSCASNLRQWGQAMNSYANDNRNAIIRPGGTHPERMEVGMPDRDPPYQEITHFLGDYLVAWNFEAVQAGDVVHHCPTSEIFRSSRQSIGYLYFAHRPTGTGAFTVYEPDVQSYTARRQLDGLNPRGPLMADPITRHDDWGNNGYNWGNSGRPSTSHINPRGDGPMGGNFLFEDGSVSWSNEDEITLGALRGDGLEYYFNIPVAGYPGD